MSQPGQHLRRKPRRYGRVLLLLVVAPALLLQCPTLAHATIVEKIGAFNVTYFNSGEIDDGVTGQKDWTATERSDIASMIMMWTMLFGQSISTPRQIELHFLWNDLPGSTLGQSSNFFTSSAGTSRTTAERLWRTGTFASLPGPGYDTQIAFDSGTTWHTGPWGPSAGQFDLRTVTAHELGHTLGFVTTYNLGSDSWSANGLTEFDKHLRDAAGAGSNTPNVGGSGAPGNFNQTANPVYFDGTNANAANGGARVPIYAPTTFSSGSSLTHMDTATFPSALMKHTVPSGAFVRAPTAVETAIMKDLGWSIIVTKTWDKGAGTLNWTDGNNWDTNGVPAPTDSVAFFTNSGLSPGDTINLGGSATVGSLSFDTTVDFSIGGTGTLTLSRGLLARSGTSSGTQTIARPLAWSGTVNWQVEGAGQLVLAGAVGSRLTKTGEGTLSVTAPLTWAAGSVMTVYGGTVSLAPAAAAAVSVADTTSQLTIASGATVTVNASNNDPLTDDAVVSRHVKVMNNSTAAGLQITAGSVTVGNIEGTGNTTVAPNALLTTNHIKQNSLSIQGNSGSPSAIVTLSRSGGTPEGLDSELSIVTLLSLANDGAPIVAPPPGGFGSSIRQYFGMLDLQNNDLIITGGSHALFAEVQDMIRAGLLTNGARGVTSHEALFAGPFAGLTWLGSVYNGIDADNNPNTPDVPLLSSFDGVPLVGGEMLLKYTWFGDADLNGLVDGNDATQFSTGITNGDPVNQATNPWFFGDFDYNGIIDGNDATFYTTGFSSGGNTTHLPEPGSLLLMAAGFTLLGLLRRPVSHHRRHRQNRAPRGTTPSRNSASRQR